MPIVFFNTSGDDVCNRTSYYIWFKATLLHFVEVFYSVYLHWSMSKYGARTGQFSKDCHFHTIQYIYHYFFFFQQLKCQQLLKIRYSPPSPGRSNYSWGYKVLVWDFLLSFDACLGTEQLVGIMRLTHLDEIIVALINHGCNDIPWWFRWFRRKISPTHASCGYWEVMLIGVERFALFARSSLWSSLRCK